MKFLRRLHVELRESGVLAILALPLVLVFAAGAIVYILIEGFIPGEDE